jgi:hypothetical protein
MAANPHKRPILTKFGGSNATLDFVCSHVHLYFFQGFKVADAVSVFAPIEVGKTALRVGYPLQPISRDLGCHVEEYL